MTTNDWIIIKRWIRSTFKQLCKDAPDHYNENVEEALRLCDKHFFTHRTRNIVVAEYGIMYLDFGNEHSTTVMFDSETSQFITGSVESYLKTNHLLCA